MGRAKDDELQGRGRPGRQGACDGKRRRVLHHRDRSLFSTHCRCPSTRARAAASGRVAPSFLLAVQLALNLTLAAAGIGLVLGVGAGAFGLVLPADAGGFTLSVALCAGALFAIDLCVAAVAGTTQVATGIGMALFYPLAFFASVYFPLTVIGSNLVNQISDALPSGAAFDALHASFLGRFPSGQDIGVLAGYTVVFAAAAMRWFRWDVEQIPQRHGWSARVGTRALTAPGALISRALTRTVSVSRSPSADEITQTLRGGVPSRYEVLPEGR